MAQIVKILVVTDGSGGFLHPATAPSTYNSDFHLGEFLKVLSDTTWEGFQLQIVKAHRENVTPAQSGADLINFDFSTHDLAQYDIIFLFAVLVDNAQLVVPAGSPARSSNATDAEVAAIARFMDAGGGVFATGDHEDLGAGLCRRLPRIRNMRRWYWDAPGPNGEPVAPRGTPGFPGHSDAELVDRHDTLVAGHDFDATRPTENYQFDDQSDNVAQTISPHMFEIRSSRYIRQSWPHPVLCSPEGMIRYLPDHAHEGQCEVPSNLGLRIIAAGYNEEEYPPGTDGTRVEPVVVANAHVVGGHPTYNPYKPPVNPKTFGVIGAYDGHRVLRGGKRMGRVVVDATWHHFFNINLVGARTSSDPEKRLGFYAPLRPGQADHYKFIKHYYRNLVYWLIPAPRGRWVLRSAIAALLSSGAFYELSPVRRLKDFERPTLDHYLTYAQLAEAYFRQAHGACFVLRILPIILYEFDPLPRIWERIERHVYPWITEKGKPEEQELGIELAVLRDAIIGATVFAMHQALLEAPVKTTKPQDIEANEALEKLFAKYAKVHVESGLKESAEYLTRRHRALGELTQSIRSLV